MNVVGLTADSLTVENYLVVATARKNHFRVVPRKDNKVAFWQNVFELRNKGNLTSRSSKSFNIKSKTFYDAITLINFEFSKDILGIGLDETQIFTEII